MKKKLKIFNAFLTTLQIEMQKIMKAHVLKVWNKKIMNNWL